MKIGGHEVSQLSANGDWRAELTIIGVGANTYLIGLGEPGLDLETDKVLCLHGVLRIVLEQLPMMNQQGQPMGFSGIQGVVPMLCGRPVPQMLFREWTVYCDADDMGPEILEQLAAEYLRIIDPPRVERALVIPGR